jgi:tetratricopeptide (TPR) repeat protein
VNINGSILDAWLGHDEDLLDVTRLIDRTEARHRISEISGSVFEENRLIASGYLASQTGAFARTSADYAALTHKATTLELGSFYQAQAAWADAMNHDLQRARADLLAAGPLNAGFYLPTVSGGWLALPDYQVDVARGDWTAALSDSRAVDALIEAQRTAHPILGLMQPTLVHPLEARALLHTGDLASAAQLISTTPLDCYLCVRVRAEIAEASHDRVGADRWYAEAVRQAPQIPFAFDEWGEARLARGDLTGAVADFREANRLEPRFADALKDWGDALARQGQWSEALAKYQAALRCAPAWQSLRQATDAAARHAG